MKTPRLAMSQFEMCKNFGARRGHGCSVKRVGIFHGLKSREEGILATETKHVDCVVTLVGEATPVGNGEDFGRLAIPLSNANSLFGRVGPMDVWRSVLESSVLGLDEVFDILLGFVVHLVKVRFESATCRYL
jgi:hypothetical protein